MARGSRRRAPTNAASTPAQRSLTDTSSTTQGAKPAKQRRSLDEREAALERQLEAVRMQKKLAAVADNKPLAAAIKASRRLKAWLTEDTYAQVQIEIGRIVDGDAPWLEGRNDASEDEDAEDSDDADGEPA